MDTFWRYQAILQNMADTKNTSAVQRVISFMAKEQKLEAWVSDKDLVTLMVEAIYTLKTKK